jgi:hypothetical protein
MSAWTALYIPLIKGLDYSKESMLGTDDLRIASNVDYQVDGAIHGRPSRAASKNFAVRDPAVNAIGASPTYLAETAFNNTGFTPRGMLRVRDAGGERAALACDGRLFTQSGSRWIDSGPFACARVDRIINFESGAVAPDFGEARRVGTASVWGLLTGDVLDREYGTAAGVSLYPGGSARCGTTTAVVVRSTTNNLNFIYRVNGGDTLTTVTIATDAVAPSDGEYPAMCCSRDATNFWVAYLTTTTNVLKVMNVSITGVVNATYTSGAIADLAGFWIDNTTVATNRVVLAFTAPTGITIRTLNATTMAEIAGVDSTYDGSSGGGGVGLDVVIGCQSDTVCWWAYRNSNAVADGDIVVGVATVGTAGSAVLVKKFWGGDAYTEAAIRWGIAHQPVLVNGRMYLTLVAGRGRANTGTWTTIDLTNWYNANASTGPFGSPTLVARGPTEGTYPSMQPTSAVALSDGSGWTFATSDWTRFGIGPDEVSSTTGFDSIVGLNRVTFSRPKTTQVGESTIFSGSIPHTMQRGQCCEMGFPFMGGIPGLSVTGSSGGAVGMGDYGVVAVWRWTDETGQLHRSYPSAIRTCTIMGGNNTITAAVSNPWLTERVNTSLRIDLYVTDTDPTDDSLHYLQSSTVPVLTDGYTVITIDTQPVTTTDVLYTDGDVLGNVHVPGDGGVAALGRRVWLAGANKVYASKLLATGFAPGFSDIEFEGRASLYVDLPAGAGRIVALEALDDKLVVFCERGVYLIQDGGPDNLGVGPDFSTPYRVSDLGIAGPRSSCSMDSAILFCSTLDTVDPARGGPWLIDRQLTVTPQQYLGRPALTHFVRTNSWVPEVAYSPERQQAYITADDVGPVTASDGVVVYDLRTGRWSTWDLRSSELGALRSITCVSGVLWALNNEPSSFGGTPGSDAAATGITGGQEAYAMKIRTSHIAADGRDGLGWSRVRAITALGAEGTGAHSLTISAIQDVTRSSNSGAISLSATSADTTWPSTRHAAEWRLPSQKCSTLQVDLSATPARARWAAIRLDIAPLPLKAPAKNRS